MKESKNSIERFETTLEGLSAAQVASRIHDGLTNKTSKVVGKSSWEIIRSNVLNFFNILLLAIAGLLIFGGHYGDLFFLIVIIPNMVLGLYEDFKAKFLLSKLRLITDPKCKVVRDGVYLNIDAKELVLDDMMILTSGVQVVVDGVVKSGSLLVNESLLTGEADDIYKKVGDVVYSGSYVVSGNAHVLANKVGKDSYIETLQSKASKFKRSHSEILKSLERLFLVLGIIVIVLATAMFATYAIQKRFIDLDSFKVQSEFIAGSMVAMIPSGLYLLTSVSLATSVINLSKKQAQVQDFYSIEMLARTNVLCVDKTGTITDGTMRVRKLVVLDNQYQSFEISQFISNLVNSTGDDNFTAKALKAHFAYQLSSKCIESLPFNSRNKYSAATFVGRNTLVLGAAENMNLVGKEGIIKRSEEFTLSGYRVLTFGINKEGIKDGKVTGFISPVALIVMQDNIKQSAIQTFEWFKNSGVEVKVISGDNTQTVSEIARQVGIENYDKAISLEGKSIEEVKFLAPSYNVFGRVSPEQKEAIIMSLKAEKKTVAMTGDGVNDILALKRADCSISMASGSDAAKNVSHIVLLDDDFDHLPDVVAEGRRVVNNVQRTSSLFLTKTVFAIFFTVLFLICTIAFKNPKINYPFVPKNLYIWEILGIGLSSFFVALEPNKEIIKGTFKKNIAKKLVPASIAMILPIIAVFVLFILQYKGVEATQVYPDYINEDPQITSKIATSMATILLSIVSLSVLVKVCSKTTKYRRVVCLVVIASAFGLLVGTFLFTFFTNKPNILGIDYNLLYPKNYFEIGLIAFADIGLYFNGTAIFEILIGERKE